MFTSIELKHAIETTDIAIDDFCMEGQNTLETRAILSLMSVFEDSCAMECDSFQQSMDIVDCMRLNDTNHVHFN